MIDINKKHSQPKDVSKMMIREKGRLDASIVESVFRMLSKDYSDEEIIDCIQAPVIKSWHIELWRMASISRRCAWRIKHMVLSNEDEKEISSLYSVLSDHVFKFNALLGNMNEDLIGYKGNLSDMRVSVQDVLIAARD